ncbi:MAG: hypothetical protein M0Z69_10855 [Actinomycetota bacterium]|nr:hypothetical protein [Actinomycetota bacterium]
MYANPKGLTRAQYAAELVAQARALALAEVVERRLAALAPLPRRWLPEAPSLTVEQERALMCHNAIVRANR